MSGIGAVGGGMVCWTGLMFSGAVVDWVKGERGKAMGAEGFEGADVIYWALCIVSAWIVLMFGVWVTKCVIEMMRGDEDDGEVEVEGFGSCDEGEGDGDGEEGEMGVEYKCEMASGRVDGEPMVGEVKGDGGKNKKGGRVRAKADEVDPCMPDNREWGEW